MLQAPQIIMPHLLLYQRVKGPLVAREAENVVAASQLEQGRFVLQVWRFEIGAYFVSSNAFFSLFKLTGLEFLVANGTVEGFDFGDLIWFIHFK